MKIAPKFSEVDIRIPESFRQYLHGYCEIQLLSEDLDLAYNKAAKVIETARRDFDVQSVIVHMPFKRSLIENTLFSGNMYTETLSLIDKLSKLSCSLDVNIQLLFHSNTSGEYTAHKYLIKHIHKTLEYMKNSNIELIIENEIASLNEYNTTPIARIADEIKDDSLGFCFDICHWKASENALKTELSLPVHTANRVKVVHFSATLDNDGFRDKTKTHGKMHLGLKDLTEDLEYLIKLGIDIQNVILVTEVCESDYKIRPDMLRELEMLHSINIMNRK